MSDETEVAVLNIKRSTIGEEREKYIVATDDDEQYVLFCNWVGVHPLDRQRVRRVQKSGDTRGEPMTWSMVILGYFKRSRQGLYAEANIFMDTQITYGYAIEGHITRPDKTIQRTGIDTEDGLIF